jgi:hypothetical protein
VFAKVGKEVIADDGIHSLEAFTGSDLVLSSRYRGERRSNGVGGSSDGSHC